MLSSGHVYALLTAITWAVAVILFRRAGEEIGPVALNYFKNAVGLALLLPSLYFFEPAREAMAWREVAVLALSGALGIGVADTLFLRSLNLLGASRSAIVDCLYSPLVVVFSFAILDERLNPLATLGAALVVAAIFLAAERGAEALPPRVFVRGVCLGAASMALMSLSIVAVKPVLERHSVLLATTIRVAGGLAVLTASVLPSERARASVREAFLPRRVWIFAIPASVFGSYVSLLFWVAGFKHARAGIAGILNQTSTLFVVLLAAAFLREPLTPRKTAAVALGLAGGMLALL